jgi:uncharacterized protein YjeT (DUF2065 family)
MKSVPGIVKWKVLPSLVALGIAAFILTVVLVGITILFYPEQAKEMTPHLLAEAAGIFFELSLVLLIVDRLAARQRRQDWAFAHRAVSERMAAAMVDVMRLLNVKASNSTYAANEDRISEFVEIGRSHINDLGNNITALASFAEPDQYKESRVIELKLSWLLRVISAAMAPATIREWEIRATKDATESIMAFSKRNQKEIKEIDDTLAFLSRGEDQDGFKLMINVGSIEDLFRWRMQLQTLIQHAYEPDLYPGIWRDALNKLAPHYFTIDWWLLSNSAETIEKLTL